MKHMPDPFHLAFPVHDLPAARAFYGGLLGCAEGRSDDRWVDFDFFGHQLVAHLVDGTTGETPVPPGQGETRGTPVPPADQSPERERGVAAASTSPNAADRVSPPGTTARRAVPPEDSGSNAVDGREVPVPHFGVVLPMGEWERLAARLQEAGVAFVIEPYVRFKGEPGEQATMFLRDPSGNALEFKAFADPSRLFARE